MYIFNDDQKAWIKRLKSGKTVQAYGQLECDEPNGGYSRCCLGEAVHVLGGVSPMVGVSLTAERYAGIAYRLKLRGSEGCIEINKISSRWKDTLKEKGYLNDVEVVKLYLTYLNDGVDCAHNGSLTHQEIGLFIEENPEAVFVK